LAVNQPSDLNPTYKDKKMDFDEIISNYNLEENLIAVESSLEDIFSENFSDPYEIGLFPEQDSDNENKCFVSLDVESKKTKLSKDQVELIAGEIEQSLLGLLSDSCSEKEMKGFKDAFSGVQIFLNGKKLR
jgi:hypothetical protein